MKKLTAILLTLIFGIILVVPVGALENGSTPRYNNTAKISYDFYISSEGEADIYLEYLGYQGVTTGATITSKIQKKTLLWWSDVDGANWTDELSGFYNSVSRQFHLNKSGKYRLVYEFEINGTGGASDVISGEVEDKF